MARGSQHVDNTTVIDHAVPHCESREVYKGVLDDTARGVFQGKIIVRQDAQKTDGHQLSRTLLLSPKAEIDTKPELEIYADDVKCSHGATAGEPEATSSSICARAASTCAGPRALIVEASWASCWKRSAMSRPGGFLAERVADWIEGDRS